MEDTIIRAFYEEYRNALSFLLERGYFEQLHDEGLVQRLVYSKNFLSFCFVLDVRDAYVDESVEIHLLDGEVRGAFISDLLTQEELEDPVLQELESEIDRLLRDKKFMRLLQVERDAKAARLLLEKQAQWIATALQQYMVKVEPRLRWATRLA